MLVEQIRESVRKVLEELSRSDGYRIYAGPHAEALVSELSHAHAGADILLASSGTAALEIALRAANIGVGDEVLLAGYDYPGNFWAIERTGARPVLIDLAADSWTIDLAQLELALNEPHAIRALVVSHLHGELQPMSQLRTWCDEHGLLLVEDSCQAVGASLNARPTGTFGHVGIASFGGGKVLSAGRGGCLISSNEELMQRARLAAGAGSGPYAMSELQAAVVAAQLKWLPEIVATCQTYFGQLAERLAATANLQSRHLFPAIRQLGFTAFYQCGWLLAPSIGTENHGRFVESLKQRGLYAGSGFAGFHRRSSRRCRRVGQLLATSATGQSGNPSSAPSSLDQSSLGQSDSSQTAERTPSHRLPPRTLARAAAVAERTWVIHHRQALEGSVSVDQACAAIEAATADVSALGLQGSG
jgi:perosamine synthetase